MCKGVLLRSSACVVESCLVRAALVMDVDTLWVQSPHEIGRS